MCPSTTGSSCIGINDAVEISDGSPKDLDQLHLAGGAQLQVDQGNRLFVNGTARVVGGAGPALTVLGQVGGSGTMRVQGDVSIASSPTATTFLTSNPTTGGGQPPPADKGDLVVEGHATMPARVASGSRVATGSTVAAGGTLSVQPGAWLAADNGTAMIINQGGTFELAGDGGLYLRAPVAGQPVTSIVNNGVLRKTAGAGTSVVDAQLRPAAARSSSRLWPARACPTIRRSSGARRARCRRWRTARCGAPATTTVLLPASGGTPPSTQ